MLVAKCGLEQVHQLNPKVKHVYRLGSNQAQVQRQLQPAAGKDQIGQGFEG